MVFVIPVAPNRIHGLAARRAGNAARCRPGLRVWLVHSRRGSEPRSEGRGFSEQVANHFQLPFRPKGLKALRWNLLATCLKTCLKTLRSLLHPFALVPLSLPKRTRTPADADDGLPFLRIEHPLDHVAAHSRAGALQAGQGERSRHLGDRPSSTIRVFDPRGSEVSMEMIERSK